MRGFKTSPGRDQAACRYELLILHHGAVHNDATHAHQHPIANSTAVQQRFMAHGNIVAKCQRETTGVKIAGMGYVKHRAVLNTAAVADADFVHITPHHRHWPYGTIVTGFNVTDHNRTWIHQSALS